MCSTILLNSLCCCFQGTTTLASKTVTKSTKLSYVILNVIFCVFLLIMTLYGDSIISVFSKFLNCPTDDKDMSICFGLSLIVRISISLVLLHLVIMIFLFTRDSFAKFVNEECFLLKYLFVLSLTFFLLFVDNKILIYYVKVSSYISIVFLLYQSIILIDFGYVWNETWVEKYDRGTTFYGVLLIFFTLMLALMTGFLIYMNIQNFWISGCTYNKWNIIFSIIIVIVLITLVLLKFNENSSILTVFFITTLFNFYNGISLSSLNDNVCNPFKNNNTNYKDFYYGFYFNLAVNLILGLITTVFVSVSSHSSSTLENATQIQVVHRVEEGPQEKQENLVEHQDTRLKIYKTNNYIVFHLMMCFFSVYLVMIFFDWKELNIDFDRWTELTSKSSSGFIIKTINCFLFIALYVWTLVAPIIFEQREFS